MNNEELRKALCDTDLMREAQKLANEMFNRAQQEVAKERTPKVSNCEWCELPLSDPGHMPQVCVRSAMSERDVLKAEIERTNRICEEMLNERDALLIDNARLQKALLKRDQHTHYCHFNSDGSMICYCNPNAVLKSQENKA